MTTLARACWGGGLAPVDLCAPVLAECEVDGLDIQSELRLKPTVVLVVTDDEEELKTGKSNMLLTASLSVF